MTDKEYVNQLRGIVRQMDLLDPMKIDYNETHERLLEEIHDMNINWKAGRRWQHWHYVVKIIILSLILAFVVWTMIR